MTFSPSKALLTLSSFTLLLGVSLLAPQANEGGGSSHTPPAKVRVFLERFCRVAPARRIESEFAEGPCPPGFRMVRYRLTSSEPAFDATSALFLTEDGKSVFVGRAMFLGDTVPDALKPGGQERLSRHFSQKAGSEMRLTWSQRPGPGGSFPVKIVVKAPVGQVETGGALARDGRWLLFGTFFPTDGDPRLERMRRLGLDQLPSLGPKDAPVTIVEISDYQCSNCLELQPALDAVMTKYAGRVRLVHVDLPQWQTHDWAFTAAEWGRCVARIFPKSYWAYERSVFYRQRDLTRANFSDLMRPEIEAMGIAKGTFAECVRDGTEQQALLGSMTRVASASLSATPTVLVNGILLDAGIATLLQPVVEEALSRH